MQKTTVLAVGKLKERFWKDACAEYLKRLSAYIAISVREIPDSTPEREETGLLAALDKLAGAHVILLDIQGTETSSPQLARKLESLAVSGGLACRLHNRRQRRRDPGGARPCRRAPELRADNPAP